MLKELSWLKRRFRGLALHRSMLNMLWGNRQHFVFFTWLSMFRWPAYTCGQVNAPPPNHRRSLNRILNKLRLKGTVQDLRKRRPSAREGVEEVTNNDKVEEVSAQLDAESERRADEPGSSTRRNPFNISPSSFWKIAKKKLKLHPFKLRKHQKLRRGNAVRRLAACGRLAAR